MTSQVTSDSEAVAADSSTISAKADSGSRARYFDSTTAFNIAHTDVPCHLFLDERAAALDPTTGTGLIPLDLSEVLDLDFPATTPLVLTRYARILAGEALETNFRASGATHYVIAGGGETVQDGERIAWRAGDVFCLPGGRDAEHKAGDQDCVLWIATDEPIYAQTHAAAPPPDDASVVAVHYPARDIQRRLAAVQDKLSNQRDAGLALIFSSESQEHNRLTTPTLSLALNSLLPGGNQRAHLHNATAISLVVQGRDCYSLIDGERVDWVEHAVMITPPGAVHSHHNGGDAGAQFLIVQDSGLYYTARTMGFEYAE
jgi:gentisate 1,2-dioxygenase